MKFVGMIMSILLLTSATSFSQDYKKWDSYVAEGVCEKVDLPYGSLDQYGNLIFGAIYKPTVIKQGVYEVELDREDMNDLFLIEGTGIYIKFRSSKPYSNSVGILEVSAYGRCEFFEKAD
jgi:hypothetical protein